MAKHSSFAWTAIVKVWDVFLNGVGRKINDGMSTNFWWDLWAPMDRPLIKLSSRNLQGINHEELVKSMVLPSGGWNEAKWRQFLPPDVIHRLLHLRPPRLGVPDEFCWRNGSDGRFSVQAAYKLIH